MPVDQENLNSELSVEALAGRLSTSIRTLLRMFQQELQTSPAKYVEDVRWKQPVENLSLEGSRYQKSRVAVVTTAWMS